MLKQQQQRELSKFDKSKLAVATQCEQLIAKYHEASERQKRIISRYDINAQLSFIISGC